jgi:hypothetical protein
MQVLLAHEAVAAEREPVLENTNSVLSSKPELRSVARMRPDLLVHVAMLA